MSATITSIYRYPVKGLSPERLESANLAVGETLTGDRRFALALASTRFDGHTPEWQSKQSFLTLLKHEKLAALETRYNESSSELTLLRNGKQVAHGKLTDPIGRAVIEDFFAAYMGHDAMAKPCLVDAGEDIALTDQKGKLVSIINLASIRDLERVAGEKIDPVRFRANIYIDGIEPWSEFNWIGRDIAAASALLSVCERTGRCGAVNVNPKTGARDQNLLKALQAGFGHTDMGVFVSVRKGGDINIGDTVGPAT